MTWRSIAVGILIAAGLSLWCYVSDHVVRAGELIGDLLPAAVYGLLVAAMILVVAGSKLAGRRWQPSSRAVVAVLVLVLFACAIPGRFTQSMPSTIMLPLHDVRTHPGWREAGVVDLVPPAMLPEVSADESRALNGFVTGLGEGDRHIGVGEVPWHVWVRPLAFWVPMIVLLTLATLALAVIVHQQWAHHEQLPYPIAVFAHALIDNDDLSGGRLFSNRLFLCGLAGVFLIELNNTLVGWWPELLVPVSLRFNFSALAPHLPLIIKGKGLGLLYPRIVFPVVGLAYLVASDVSLSMAVGPWIYCAVAGIFMTYGVELRPGREMALSIETFLYSGGYVGILLVTLYTGRRFYRAVLQRSLGGTKSDEVPSSAVFAMRGLLVCSLTMLALLVWVGVPLLLTCLYLLFAIMIFVVVSRIVAETGAYIVGTFVFPGVLIWGFFGPAAVGPAVLVTLFVMSTVLLLIPGRAPMAFMVHALRLADLARLRPGRAAAWGALVVVISVAIALPTAIYWHYDRGAPNYGWPRKAATYPFENGVQIVHKLKAQGSYTAATEAGPLQRAALLSPSWPHVTAFAVAALLAVGFAAGRLSFHFWPLHPVIFLFLGGSAAIIMSCSFFLGWLIKAVASKYGGARLYRQLRPLMIGITAGSLLGQLVPIAVGTARFLLFGVPAA